MVLALTFSVASASNGYMEYQKCAGCHGDEGEKKALSRSMPIGGVEFEKTLKQLLMYREGSLNRYGFGGIMTGQVMNMTDSEIERLADYISYMKRVGVDENSSIVAENEDFQ